MSIILINKWNLVGLPLIACNPVSKQTVMSKDKSMSGIQECHSREPGPAVIYTHKNLGRIFLMN